MVAIWARRAEDCCIHPGWDILNGWPEIRESWRAIFANTNYMRIELDEVSAEIMGPVGRVICVENIFTIIDSQTIHSRVACTNLFLQIDDRWKLVLHQGSPIASQQVSTSDVDLDLN
jgi:ketosteroid isomerase-like protein